MANRMANDIEKAWLEAGMKICGYVNFAEIGGTTYQVSFGYKADDQKPDLRKKMVKIADDSGCYLFLDFAEPGKWQEGTVKFVHKDALVKWRKTLEEKLKKHRNSFGYLQEQETSFAVTKLLLSATAYLDASLQVAISETVFESNGLELQKHIEEISKIQQSEEYIKEVNLCNEIMYGVLADTWWHK